MVGARLGVLVVLLLLTPMAGCREERADREVARELRALEIASVPQGATELERDEVLGGGSDEAGVAGATTVRLTFASPREPAEVTADYHATYGDEWSLHDNRYAPGGAALIGTMLSDRDTTVTVEARTAATDDDVPPGTASVVVVSVSRTRD